MEFEFDPAKSAANKAKHGIDFDAAQAIFEDEAALDVVADTDWEARSQRIGRVGEHIWACYYTICGDRIRIISVRRARRAERGLYGSQSEG